MARPNYDFDPLAYAAEILEQQISPLDPVAWAKKRAGTELWSKQREIAMSVVNNKLTAVKSGHGVGKSFTTSTLATWWIDTHPPDDTMVISTAPSSRQVSAIMWEEIRKIHRRAGLQGEVQRSDRWLINDIEVGFGRKPQDYDKHAFQGLHRKYVLIIIDEACHDDQTDVLTDSGWMRFADLTGDEKLLTMDPVTHKASYSLPTKIVAKPYRGPMYYYAGKGMNYAVTPDHQMLYGQKQFHNGGRLDWRKSEKQNIKTWNNKYIKKVIDWDVDDNPELSDDFLKLMGWFGSEGHVNKAVNFVNFTQLATKFEHHEIIRICQRLGYNPKVYGNNIRIHDTELAKFFVQWGRTQLERRVPDVVRMASARQIGIYLDAYSAGDGYHKSNGREIIYTSSPDMADDLQELILKTGMPSVVNKRELKGQQRIMPDGHIVTSSVDGYVVSRPSRRSDAKMYNENEEIRDYDGMVYCATVPPNHLLFTRRNGYTMWSGNCGVDEWLWIAALSMATGPHCRIIAIGNPDDPSSHFAKVCNPGSGWNVIKISVFDSPNFTNEVVSQETSDKLTGPEWVEYMEREVGRDSPTWISKVEGEFPDIDEFSVIPLRWIHEAQERWQEWNESYGGIPPEDARHVIGCDIARFGGDKNAFAHKFGHIVTAVDVSPGGDTERTADRIADEMHHRRNDVAVIDTNGVGAGVFDKLRRRGRSVIPVNVANRTSAVDRSGQVAFYNIRAAATWKLREDLDPSRNPTLCLPPDEKLAADLSAPRWKTMAGGKIVIEDKGEVRKRIGRSPDRGDAVILANFVGSSTLMESDDSSFAWRDVDDEDFNDDPDVAIPWEEGEDDWRKIAMV